MYELWELLYVFLQSPDGWPKIVIWLLSSGSRVAYVKISAADILFSNLPQQCGRNCGKVQTLYLKVSEESYIKL